eukprot:scaffold296376_cov18-Prasinocladus_malaysianus.AAC.1
MQIGPKTLAASPSALPGATSNVGGSEVVFYMPVPWRLDAVEAYVAEPCGREEPDVVVCCSFRVPRVSQGSSPRWPDQGLLMLS